MNEKFLNPIGCAECQKKAKELQLKVSPHGVPGIIPCNHLAVVPKEKLEVLEVQIMLGEEEGVDGKAITPGFWHRMSECITEFLKKENVEHLAMHQQFLKDDGYKGVSRDFHLRRNSLHRASQEETKVI